MVECEIMSRCREVYDKLNIPGSSCDSKGDKCFCKCCYQDLEVYSRGTKPYEMPYGGCRFGIKVDKDILAKNPGLFKWHNSYHGTKKENIKKIIQVGFYLPGTTTPDGTEVEILPGHIPGCHQIYTSPSFRCSRYGYSSFTQHKGRMYHALLQIRQKPGSYKIQHDTYDHIVPPPSHINSDEMEYFTTDTNSIVVIGVVIFEGNEFDGPEVSPYDYQAISTKERAAKALKGIVRKHPDFISRLDDTITSVKEAEQILKEIEAKVNETLRKNDECTLINVCSNGASIASVGMLFTPAFAVGLVGLGLSTTSRLASGVIQTNNKRQIGKEFSKLKTTNNKVQYIFKIIESLYDQEPPEVIQEIFSGLSANFFDLGLIENVVKYVSSGIRITYNIQKVAGAATQVLKVCGKAASGLSILLDVYDTYSTVKENEKFEEKLKEQVKNQRKDFKLELTVLEEVKEKLQEFGV